MKKTFSYLLNCLAFVIPLAAFTGCSGANGTDIEAESVRIGSCTTRGEDGQDIPVKEFGMFATDSNGNLLTGNIRMQHGPAEWSPTGINCDETGKYVYAYYPYSQACTTLEMPMDLRTQTDYLRSLGAMVALSCRPAVSITLSHVLSKLTFKVQGQTVENVNTGGYKYSATCNIRNGLITRGTAQGEISSSGSYLLVYPGAIETGMAVSLSIEGNTYDFVLPAATLLPGKEYTYTLALHGQGVEIVEINLTPWQSGGNYEGFL